MRSNPAHGSRLSDKTDPMERFDFRSSATWGIPDYSHYPLPKTRSDPSPEEFLDGVEGTLAKDGFWRATWEYRMGGTTTVEITPSNVYRVRCYHVSVRFGGLVTTADYDTLELALRASPPMAYALASVREKGAWVGLIGG
jgi:hypothetical protein